MRSCPPTTYVRWSAFRDRFLDRDADKLRPMFAADALWKAAIKRSGMSDKGCRQGGGRGRGGAPPPTVTLVKAITVKGRGHDQTVQAAQIEDMVCLEGTWINSGGT